MFLFLFTNVFGIDMNMIPVDLLMLLAGRISYQTCSNLLSI